MRSSLVPLLVILSLVVASRAFDNSDLFGSDGTDAFADSTYEDDNRIAEL